MAIMVGGILAGWSQGAAEADAQNLANSPHCPRCVVLGVAALELADLLSHDKQRHRLPAGGHRLRPRSPSATPAVGGWLIISLT
ncbi:hypothetical protein OG978_03865 [Streptomyces sp. NBC_01591]|uniref:hypothetical protein n=1 Tax=Streptomyces sp. NBC_01591 TaxID=2975888 RepID=UPI002DDB9E70|nr:hypothetical protein [Streptomyces sp. NBC_01591]WSD66589.1 hypothetical protein OG978_03865 [Streptomyces sp. NBC_01591]